MLISKAELDARDKRLAKKFQKEFEEMEKRFGKTKLLTPEDELVKTRLARKHHATMSKRMLERKKYEILIKKEKPLKTRQYRKKKTTGKRY